MVLENVSSPASADFTDGAPASDGDPYNASSRSYNIDTSSFPKPIPIIGRLLGYTEELNAKMITDRFQAVSKSVERDLTNEEADALAYWGAKQAAIFSYATPLGWAGAVYRWNSTKDIFKFPFWQPDLEKLDRGVFPTPKYAALRGQVARSAWSALRLGCYGIVSVPIAQILIASYITSTVIIGQGRDPRMKSILDSMKEKAKEKMDAQLDTRRQQTSRSGQRSPGPISPEPPVDDASPTGGMGWDEPIIADTSSDMSTPAPFKPSSRYSTSAPSMTPQAPTARPAMDRVEMDKAPDFFGTTGDSSPTNGQGMSSDTRRVSQGSAWDRLRNGGNSSGSSSDGSRQGAWQRQQRQNETLDGQKQGDKSAISRSDQERSYARDGAQRDFDAKVERERRGGDFSAGSGDQKRW